MKINTNESKKIKYHIDFCCMKHIDISTRMKISKSSFSKKYNGKCRWTTDELKHLAQIIGCNYLDLVD